MARFSVDGEAETSNPISGKRQKSSQIDNSEQPNEHQQQQKAAVSHYDDNHTVSSSEEEDNEGSDPNTQLATSEPPPTRNGAIFVTITDPDVLECPICYESFSIPVFQCVNGHAACSSCYKKLAHKCPSCSMPIGYNRCRAFEKVLKSVKLPCHNLKYGCKEMVLYSKKSEHDKVCNYMPCPCPLSSCKFVGSDRQLYRHFSKKHKGSALRFQFKTTFPVFLTHDHKSLILQEEGDNSLFILKNTADILGNVITVDCIGPPSLKQGYHYMVEAKMEGSTLRFQSLTKSIQKVNHDDPHSDTFLVVPGSFFGSYGQIILDVCIWDHGSYPTEITSAA
ncbi:putative E3 ubiquitin-protein ligase SINA-like 6 [Mercurialis annua]|uniref:putative E3 ubiquitin-protein ligase SINA-like 6 n=1 Tax=Mercurialis annua TaxID=3986 RepID=UPI002160B93E|nr:putative E3 ubiquitin-protein ligase SINA-like 6 [Mercurialis annua]